MGIEYLRGGIENKDHLRNKLREVGGKQDQELERRKAKREQQLEDTKRERHAVLRKRGTIGKRVF